jgi:replicative superfamily II helicase
MNEIEQKEIEEMLKLMCEEYGNMCGECPCTDCANELHAEKLYNAGYRQVKEIIDKVDDMIGGKMIAQALREIYLEKE